MNFRTRFVALVIETLVCLALAACQAQQPVTVRHTKVGDKDVLEVTFQPGISVRAGNVSLAPIPVLP